MFRNERSIVSLRNFLKNKLLRNLRLLIHGYPISLALAWSFPGQLYRIGLYPRKIKAPDGSEYFVSSIEVLRTNLRDYYEYDYLKSFIPRKGWKVLDVGAFHGLYSVKVARIVGLSSKVYAFEPNPLAFYWLKKNIKLNKVESICKPYPLALGSFNGRTEFLIPLSYGGMELATFFRNHLNKQGIKEFKKFNVEVRTLDSVFGQLVKEDEVDLVKIDVEGAEVEVLRGASETLTSHKVKKLIVEVHLTVNSIQDVTKILLTRGYKMDSIQIISSIKCITYFSVK